MTFDDFLTTTGNAAPPKVSVILEALWYEKRGDWEMAHNLVQDVNTRDASWIHAYLHRKEGDISNAQYWYSRAGKSRPSSSLDEEWESLVRHFLQN